MRRVLWLAVLLLALRPALGEEAAHLFALYRTGEIARVERALPAALARRPEDPDLRLLQGLVALRRGARAQARRAFEAALRLAPDYRDARLALARLAWWEGEPRAARAWLRPLMERAAEDAEVLALLVRLDLAEGRGADARRRLAEARRRGSLDARILDRLARRLARATSPIRRVRASARELAPAERPPAPACCLLTAYARRAGWSNGRDPWAEGRLALRLRLDPATALELAGELRRRFGKVDVLAELALARRIGDLGAGRLAFTLGPGAGFSPRLALDLAFEAGPALAPHPSVRPLARLRLARYADGTALQLGLGARTIVTPATTLSLRVDLARDAGGRADLGGVLRVDRRIGDWRLFAGAGWLLDDEHGRSLERTAFLGWSTPVRAGVRLFCDLDLAHRGATRLGFGCGMALALGGPAR